MRDVEPFDCDVDTTTWTKSILNQVRQMLKIDIKKVDSFWHRLRRPSSSPQYLAPIPYVIASKMLRASYVLLIDEVQLQDVSSALLLSDVLIWYWRMGGVVVGTSNRVPEETSLRVWWMPRSTLRHLAALLSLVVSFMSRAYHPKETHACSRFSNFVKRHSHPAFHDRRELKYLYSLGPADYLILSSTFRTIVITGIPIIRLPSGKNQARRFISLVDALYESRCRVVCLSDIQLDDLFQIDIDRGTDNTDVMLAESVSLEKYRPSVVSYRHSDASEREETRVPLETLSIFSGKDEQFAFKRAFSRLVEMTSPAYHMRCQWDPKVQKWQGSSVVADSGKITSASEPHAGFSPQLSENHVLGVREDWGAGGRWGKGASVYDEKK
ncbi:hypothetical protein EDD85DRAFT_102523 [Armillaria nabsnona]|nr:hypothetical protein EDD85DRAFT_102523 [Armillaria nabsnona]